MELHKEERLEKVHPDLVEVVKLAASRLPFPVMVLEGLRTLERQQRLVAQGASTTLRSRHLAGTDGQCCAVDLAPMIDLDGDGDLDISWAWPQYHIIADQMKKAAHELKTPIEWGGDWKSFKDGPHWQLPWSTYP